MPRIVELSGPLTPGQWDYNVLELSGAEMPAVQALEVATIARNGFSAHELRMSTLSGTYTETSAHLLQDGPSVDALDLRELIRPAKIMRLPEMGPRGLVEPEHLERHAVEIDPGDALLIDTGWGPRWDQPGYVRDAPAFSVRTLDWLVAQPFSILGLDTPVMECQWCAAEGRDDDAGALLEPLYRRGMVLLAPLVNLELVHAASGTLMTFPLRMQGVCAAPSRTVFVEDVNWAHDLDVVPWNGMGAS